MCGRVCGREISWFQAKKFYMWTNFKLRSKLNSKPNLYDDQVNNMPQSHMKIKRTNKIIRNFSKKFVLNFDSISMKVMEMLEFVIKLKTTNISKNQNQRAYKLFILIHSKLSTNGIWPIERLQCHLSIVSRKNVRYSLFNCVRVPMMDYCWKFGAVAPHSTSTGFKFRTWTIFHKNFLWQKFSVF